MTTTAFSFLPYLPLNPVWIKTSPAMEDEDSRLGKAFIIILMDMWSRGGSIPASHAYISKLTGLDTSLIEEKKEVLLGSFSINPVGRLEFPPLADVCAMMNERFGKEMEAIALTAMMAVQDPDNCSLALVESTRTKVVKGLTLFPKNFVPDADSLDYCLQLGYQHGDVSALMVKFKDYSQSKGVKNKDWQAGFRLFIQRESEFRQRTSVGQGGLFPVTAPSRGDQLAMKNMSMLFSGGGMR